MLLEMPVCPHSSPCDLDDRLRVILQRSLPLRRADRTTLANVVLLAHLDRLCVVSITTCWEMVREDLASRSTAQTCLTARVTEHTDGAPIELAADCTLTALKTNFWRTVSQVCTDRRAESEAPDLRSIMKLYTAADMAKPTNHANENIETSSAGAVAMTPAETRKPGIFGSTPASNATSAAGFQPSCADHSSELLLAGHVHS